MPVMVVNKHHWDKGGTYIGRGGVFGNPYTHLPLAATKAMYQVSTREEAIERYREHLQRQWVEDDFFRICLTSLVKAHLRGETVVLACTCKPKSCHGDVIAEYIFWMAELGVVTLDDEE
jgi:hypothetical protein